MTQSSIYSGVVCDKKRKLNDIGLPDIFHLLPFTLCACTWINDRNNSFHITAFHCLVERRGYGAMVGTLVSASVQHNIVRF